MWKAIGNFFRNLFGLSKNEKVKETVRKVMDVIRKAVNHPVADVIVSLTATDIDDRALQIVRSVLNGYYVDVAARYNRSPGATARFGSVSIQEVPNALVNGIAKLPEPDKQVELTELERAIERELKAQL